MLYYWTRVYNTGAAHYWEVESEEALLIAAKEKYGESLFDYGMTTQKKTK